MKLIKLGIVIPIDTTNEEKGNVHGRREMKMYERKLPLS